MFQAGRPSVLDAPLDPDVGPLRSRPGSAAQPISRSAPTGSLQVDFSRSGFEQRGVPRAGAATRDLSARRPARFHAALEGGADAPGANGQRVHRDAQPFRQVAPTIDLLPQRIAVVPRRPARVVPAGASGDNSRGSRDAVPAAPGLLPSPAALCAIRMAGRGAGGRQPEHASVPDGRPPAGRIAQLRNSSARAE